MGLRIVCRVSDLMGHMKLIMNEFGRDCKVIDINLSIQNINKEVKG